MTRPVNRAGLDLIRSFETLRLDVYDDGYGYATVGYGHRTTQSLGTIISQSTAETLFQSDVESAAACIEEATEGIDLTGNQFGALASLVFNIGETNFRSSTLRKDLLAGDFADVAKEDERWNHSGGKFSAGLARRRAAEIALWNTEDA